MAPDKTCLTHRKVELLHVHCKEHLSAYREILMLNTGNTFVGMPFSGIFEGGSENV